jgi:flavodoxin
MTKKLVVYDSVFGNTEKFAQAIGEAQGNAPVIKVTEVRQEDLGSDGFSVSGTQGPLIEGELERAQDWARQMLG